MERPEILDFSLMHRVFYEQHLIKKEQNFSFEEQEEWLYGEFPDDPRFHVSPVLVYQQ